MNRYTYNMFIGKETLYNEYKEFRFNINKYKITNSIASKFCESNKFDFNDMVMDNILKYIKYYIPKYFCAFMNSNINGNLFIGVNDYGFIKGIPFQGVLDTEYLNTKIIKYIEKNIKSVEPFDIHEHMTINWVKVEIDEKPSTNVSPYYIKYLNDKKEYEDRYNDWLEKLEDWRIRFDFANRKLVDIVNTPESRIILIDYIKKSDPNNITLQLLNSDYKIEYKDHNELILLKEDQNNIYYWVVRWKDEMIDRLRKEKPIFNNDFPNYNGAINLITNVGEMIPYWIANNHNMNLYMLHIMFKPIGISSKDMISTNLFSYLESKDIWRVNYRTTMRDGSPTSVSFKDLF